MRIKMGTVVPKMGTFVHLIDKPMDYRTAMATVLHEELGDTHRAIKVAMLWTGASERTVKYWFAGERGPRGDHLIALARDGQSFYRRRLICGLIALHHRPLVKPTVARDLLGIS